MSANPSGNRSRNSTKNGIDSACPYNMISGIGVTTSSAEVGYLWTSSSNT